ncbi:MAG: hypothetical protein Q9209_003123 [Squamulea sp. 1 TL-2023]
MSKIFKKGMFGGSRCGNGERSENGSSTKAQKPLRIHENDEAVARALSEEINGGQGLLDNPEEQQDSGSAYPEEIENAIKFVQRFAKETLRTTCRKCQKPLIENLDVEYWIGRWKKGGGSTTVKCRCGTLTCLGCADEPRVGSPKHMGEYEGTKLDWCCTRGSAFVAWVILCQYDHMELDLQSRTLDKQHQGAHRDLAKGVGFGKNIRHNSGVLKVVWDEDGKAEYRYPHLSQALDFKQADAKTDDLTRWVIGMLVMLLPKREETSKKVPPALAPMIELSLLQDRTAQLLRNDSLQDANKRGELYFATFAFVDRLYHHDALDHLVKEDRFMKKQSAGLHAIATESTGKGKGKAIAPLMVARRSEGMASSLIACLTNLATQSKVLLSGSHNEAAGKDMLEIATRIQKLHTRLVPPVAKLATVTTWKEYLQAYGVTRKAGLAKYLCREAGEEARKIKTSPKGRMARLVTETSEMTTSLPENIFVMIDEDRPDIMKALIIGPKGTPYEGGLFEFDIVCKQDYPFKPPLVLFLTTGHGTVLFNPNLYKNGMVCLSLLGTWPGAPETRWQPHKSTIVSILVSIQSMIFVDWPLENEPAFQGCHNTPRGLEACLKKNRTWRRDTLKYATLDWLIRPERRNGLWKYVVNDYFRFCGRGVVESAKKWEKDLAIPPTKLVQTEDGMGGMLSVEIEKAVKQYVK